MCQSEWWCGLFVVCEWGKSGSDEASASLSLSLGSQILGWLSEKLSQSEVKTSLRDERARTTKHRKRAKNRRNQSSQWHRMTQNHRRAGAHRTAKETEYLHLGQRKLVSARGGCAARSNSTPSDS